MRTVKASEVVKGMRVRFEASNGDATVTTEGVISEVSGEYAVSAWFGSYCIGLNPDHPVTVLAEPEPEWVEGAWYWIDGGPMIRRANGWHSDPTDRGDFPDLDDSEVDSASVKRVLIVDWPGDDVARTLSKWPDGTAPLRDLDRAVEKVADAIRTQGGVR